MRDLHAIPQAFRPTFPSITRGSDSQFEPAQRSASPSAVWPRRSVAPVQCGPGTMWQGAASQGEEPQSEASRAAGTARQVARAPFAESH